MTVSETSTSDSNVFNKTQVADLMASSLFIKNSGAFFIVRLDATNVVRVALKELLNQAAQSSLKVPLETPI